MPHRPTVRRGAAVAVPLTAVLALAACSSSGDNASTSSGGDAHQATVTITSAHGCTPDRTSFQAGGISFHVINKDATAVSEVELLSGDRIVGEKENVVPGLTGDFAVTVGAGSYTVYCPGGNPERSTIKVTGQAAAPADQTVAALLNQATTGYAKYVNTQIAYLLSGVRTLDTALHGTNLTAAQNAYKTARPFYEKIEPVAESFSIGKDNIDADIDARAGDVPVAQWRGFHRIEKGLFASHSLSGLAPYGDHLVADVKRLQGLALKLKYQPTELANGAQELLDEVAATKITGEEERYSHIDLLDFANNDEGSEQAFAQLQPALQKIDSALTSEIATEFAALDALVNKYRSRTDASGFVLYTSLTTADKHALAAAVKAVQEPLSQVASKIANQ